MGIPDEVDVGQPTTEIIINDYVKEMGDDARRATEIEHEMTFIEGCKMYPAAIGWSVFFSLGIIMTAFDPQLLGSLYAAKAFQRDFGYLYNGSYIISAPWQTALGMGNPIGQVLGALFVSYPMEKFGRKWVCQAFLFTKGSFPVTKLISIDFCSVCNWYCWLCV
jgi:SP family general alpha glucoside:H+ symporter-like MFS transporter